MGAEATKHRQAFGNMLLALSKQRALGLLEATEKKRRKAEASEIQKDKEGRNVN